MMPHIVWLLTGGTIAMETRAESGSGAVPSLAGKDFLEKMTGLIPEDIRVSVEDIVNVPGASITIEVMEAICKRVEYHTSQEEVDGIIITQGTDAIEESAYFTDLCYGGEKPVVFVGAMRAASEVGYDGLHNLLSAMTTAASGQARGLGVLLVMNQQIQAAAELRKLHTMRPDAFQSPPSGPIGEVVFDKLEIKRRITRPESIMKPVCEGPVFVIPMVTDIEPEALEWIFNAGAQGVIIEGLGGGRIPPPVLSIVDRMIQENIPVVATTRCGIGHISDRYGYEGAHSDLQKRGLLFAHNLSSAKARIKLMLALGNEKKEEELKSLFSSCVD